MLYIVQCIIEMPDEFMVWPWGKDIILHKCEGFVSIRELNLMDEFRHDETDYALLGQKTKRKFRMGDKIKIKVVATNLEKRQMDFELLQDNKKTGNKAAIKKIPAKRKK